LLPPRAELYARINARVEAMMASGWAQEVRGLMQASALADAKAFQFIGYSELRRQIESARAPEEAVPAIQQATRRFAKRQITWFRKEQGVQWLTGLGDDPDLFSAALKIAGAND
jgi:tRNA dimethylallyltransferase